MKHFKIRNCQLKKNKILLLLIFLSVQHMGNTEELRKIRRKCKERYKQTDYLNQCLLLTFHGKNLNKIKHISLEDFYF